MNLSIWHLRIKRLLRQNRGFIVFLLCFGLFRTAVADWNPVPTGSMRPTILEGDVMLINRLAYAVKIPLTDRVIMRTGEPARGDIVTFSSPTDGMRLIKRVVALPGDVVEMRAKRLVINGVPVDYADAQSVSEEGQPAQRLTEALPGKRHAVQWFDVIARRPDFGPVSVPPGHYLMLGDNRDNSADSRYIGLVPRALLIGRAERILVSVDMLGDWSPRFARFGAPPDALSQGSTP